MICEYRMCAESVPPKRRPSHPERRFCSVICRNRAISDGNRTLEGRSCLWCGASFSPRKPSQGYCARPCRLEATAATETTEKARFWSKVDKSGPVPADRRDLGACWIWTGRIDDDGYGLFTLNGGKAVRAHRYAIGTHDAPSTDHLCRVRNCVRDTHLESVSVRVNTLRGMGPAAINARKTHCTQGHALVDGNLYGAKDGRRACRRCAIDRRRERYFAAKAARVVEHVRDEVTA